MKESFELACIEKNWQREVGDANHIFFSKPIPGSSIVTIHWNITCNSHSTNALPYTATTKGCSELMYPDITFLP